MPNHYKALGVHKGSSQEALREAYLAQVRKMHPDAGGNVEDFMRAVEAWGVLSDYVQRGTYERDLAREFPECGSCSGKGFTEVQHGFTQRVRLGCKSCEGAGVLNLFDNV